MIRFDTHRSPFQSERHLWVLKYISFLIRKTSVSVKTYQLSIQVLFWFICAFHPENSSIFSIRVFAFYSYFPANFKEYLINSGFEAFSALIINNIFLNFQQRNFIDKIQVFGFHYSVSYLRNRQAVIYASQNNGILWLVETFDMTNHSASCTSTCTLKSSYVWHLQNVRKSCD